MGRQISWDDIPDSNIVPEGIYHVEIVDIEETLTKAQALMYKGAFSIIEPAEYAGFYIRDMYTIGKEDDPLAEQLNTWKASIGARRLKKMLKDAQVPMDPDLDNVIAAAPGAQFLASVTLEIDDGTRNEGKYKGMSNNRVGSTFPLGMKEVGITGQAAPAPAAPAAPRPVAPAAPRPPVAPPAAAPARPVTVTAGRPIAGSPQTVRAAPPAAPAAAPAPRPAPRAAPARPTPVAAPQAAVAAEAAPEASYPCAICKQAGETNFMVLESEFEAHVAQHA